MHDNRGCTVTRRVIYTAIIGEYDIPSAIGAGVTLDKGWDFLCFSNGPLDLPTPWQLREVRCLPEGSAATNRWVKFCAHTLLGEYDEALYLDGNLDLLASPTEVFSRLRDDCSCAFIEHPQRSTVSEEVVACLLAKKVTLLESVRLILSQSRGGFTDKLPLTANRLFARRLKDARVNEMFESVFHDYLRGPARDQLHLQYALERFAVPHAVLPRQWALDTFAIRSHRNSDPGKGRASRWFFQLILGRPLRFLLLALARINLPGRRQRD